MDTERLREHQVAVAKECILRVEGVREILWDQWRDVQAIDYRAGQRVAKAIHTLAKAQGVLEAHVIINGGEIDE